MAENNIGGLFARIAKIAGLVGAVNKSGKSGEGGVNYKYHSADDIMGHLNKLMAEHGLAIIPNVIETTIVKGADEIERWLIVYEYIIGDVDGNTMTARWTGEAPLYGRRKDGSLFSDDKSLGKAHTYAYKYYIMKLFMVSTVDTDDLDTNVVDKGNQGNRPANKPAPAKDPLDPDTHLGARPEKELLYTEAIKSIEVKLDKNKKEFLSADGITIFTRQPFRDLGYPQEFIDKLGIVGQVFLPEGKFIRIAYSVNGKFKTAEKIHRIDTEETVSAIPVKQ